MVWQRRDRGLEIAGAVAEFVPAAWLLTPRSPKTPQAQPASMAVEPQMMRPLAIPMVCTIGTTASWPVHQMTPPSIASGSKGGGFGWRRSTQTPTSQMPMHRHHWKKKPSPTSYCFTGK